MRAEWAARKSRSERGAHAVRTACGCAAHSVVCMHCTVSDYRCRSVPESPGRQLLSMRSKYIVRSEDGGSAHIRRTHARTRASRRVNPRPDTQEAKNRHATSQEPTRHATTQHPDRNNASPDTHQLKDRNKVTDGCMTGGRRRWHCPVCVLVLAPPMQVPHVLRFSRLSDCRAQSFVGRISGGGNSRKRTARFVVGRRRAQPTRPPGRTALSAAGCGRPPR